MSFPFRFKDTEATGFSALNRRQRRAAFKPQKTLNGFSGSQQKRWSLEALEPRVLLSADPMTVLLNSVLGYNDTAAVSVNIELYADSVDPSQLMYKVTDTNGAQDFAMTAAQGVNFVTGSGKDTITISFAADFKPAADFTVSFDAGAGTDTLTLTSFAAGYSGNLVLSAETVVLDAALGDAATRLGNVTVTANAVDVLAASGGSASAQAAAQIAVNHSIFATGTVSLLANAATSGAVDWSNYSGLTGNAAVAQTAVISFASDVVVDALTIQAQASVGSDVSVLANNRMFFDLNMAVTSRSEVSLGARVSLLASGPDLGPLAAIDLSATELTTASAHLSGLSIEDFWRAFCRCFRIRCPRR